MSNKSYNTSKNKETLIPPHGGYRKLKSYQSAEIVYDFTVQFCKKYKRNITYKTYEQMIGAARSGKQNIVEGSLASGTSKKTELKLVGIARASLEELLQDCEDYSREHELVIWPKDSEEARKIRDLAYKSNRSYKTYARFLATPVGAINCLICLINQTTYLLDKQLKSLEKDFLDKGGFTERLYQKRKENRGY